MTDKQRRFIEEYLVDLNATQAAIRAGYSEKDADVQGPRLLGNVRIQDALVKAIEARSRRTEISQDNVLREIARVAFSRIDDIATFNASGIQLKDSDQLSEDALAIISELTEKMGADGNSTLSVKRYDKVRALELLGRHLGMFVDKSHNINEDITSMSPEERRKRIDELISKRGS